MNALLILIPVSLVLVAAAVAIFFWAVRHSQFDDLDTPEILPLLDEPPGGEAAGPEPDPDQDASASGHR